VAAIQSGSVALVLGGDHSITYSIVNTRHGNPVTIVHFDAHPDIYDEFEGSRSSHACLSSRLRSSPSPASPLGFAPTLRGQSRRGAAGADIVGFLRAVDDPMYLSFDLDLLEPGLAPGVSHRESGGRSLAEAVH
jgi:arginase family enzyme